MSKIVVLDVDDVIYDLNGEVEKLVNKDYPNFSFKNARTYSLNSDLTDEQKEEEGIPLDDPWNGLGAPKSCIMNNYASVEPYRRAKLFDISKLGELCRKCTVIFHTAGMNVDVCKFKVAKLNSLLNNLGVKACVSVQLTGSMVFVHVAEGDDEAVKERGFVPKPALVCDYVVEDSIENLKEYKNCVRLLVDKPYNKSRFYSGSSHYYSTRVSSLNEAIEFILNEVDNE